MTGPSSAPRGERAGTPGTTWEQHLVHTETVVPDCPASTTGHCIAWNRCDTEAGECVEDISTPPPTPDRATRRALARAARRNK